MAGARTDDGGIMNNRRIILAGGSGFLGALLSRHFAARGDEIIILTRSPQSRSDGMKEIFWDGKTAGDWMKLVDGADAVINLAGRSVNCRYHQRNRREILNSRIDSTRILGEAISRSRRPPPVWFNSSTATIYKHSLNRPMDEATGVIGATPEAKDAFSVDVAVAWERTFNEAATPATRKVALRSAMVLGTGRNSVFPALRRLVRLGLGGRMGSGQQFVSWIHHADFCRAIEWLIDRSDLDGVVNLAAPHPIPNCDVMRILRCAYGIPFGLPAASWMLELGALFLRTETELIIKSRRVIPGRLVASGFRFSFSTFDEAIKDLKQGSNA
jgi:uncharacterized protein (TIGR01777 family)